MLEIEQQHRFSDLGVRQADAARKPRLVVCDLSDHTMLLEFLVRKMAVLIDHIGRNSGDMKRVSGARIHGVT
jgi:hypothetical protein